MMTRVDGLKAWVSEALAGHENESGSCHVSLCLDNTSVDYFQQAVTIGATLNEDGTISQKELAGRLKVGHVQGDGVFKLIVDTRSIVHGSEEGVQIVRGFFNFHTHPIETYERYSVGVGWPSATDYLGFITAATVHNTICHFVVCAEGYYVISLDKDLVTKSSCTIDKKLSLFTKSHYDIDKHSGSSYSAYIDTINSIRYEGVKLLEIQFFPWGQSDQPFNVFFRKTDGGCPLDHIGETCD